MKEGLATRADEDRRTKRWFDLSVSAVLALPAALVVGAAAIAIRLDSGGPAVFRQTRVGRHGRPFTLYKLRTMAASTEHRASHEVSAAQITRVGRLLRSAKIDELPQLLNVLLGQMSLVGPRPCLPVQEELIAARHRLGVDRLRPGVTGPAQIQGVDMSEPQKLAALDATYIDTQSLVGDTLLLLRTFTGGGRGDAIKSERAVGPPS